MNSQEELDQYRIREITDTHRPLLGTVDWVDNSIDTWIECVDDNGEKVRLVPDMTGWRDGRREVMIMNCRNGENRKLFFQKLPGGVIVPHDAMMTDEQAKQVMWAIPFPCLEWAANRAR
jgi:hypothetical protein